MSDKKKRLDYMKMSLKEKQHAKRQHGAPQVCVGCDQTIAPEDMHSHNKRCPGRAPVDAPQIPLRCLGCGEQVSGPEMPEHLTGACKGRPEPHPNSRWASFRQALQMGVDKKTLGELAAIDVIRTKGEIGAKRYLVRDIAKFINSKADRARISEAKARAKATAKPKAKPKAKPIAKRPAVGVSLRMSEKELSVKLNEYIKEVGGLAQASRKLDTPLDTVKKAASGGKVRDSTRLWIETALANVGAI